MRFEPLVLPMTLPPPGTAAEHALWDLKKEVECSRHFELAKDIAAFANHFGGTILVGAKEREGRVSEYFPMLEGRALEIENAMMTAVERLCRPSPTFNYTRFAKDTGFVLAVNVWPSIATVIGIEVRSDSGKCGYGGAAFVFPTRLVNHSDTIGPEAFVMHMLPQLRRTLLLLYAISPDADLYVSWGARGVSVVASGSTGYRLARIDEQANYVAFVREGREERAALDAVELVHRTHESPNEAWRILIRQ